MRGLQRRHEVVAAAADLLEILGALGALIEDERELRRLVNEPPESRAHRREDLGERADVGARALIEDVAERDLAFLGDDEREPELAQIVPPRFAVAALRELAARVRRVNVRMEVRRVVREEARRELLRDEDAADDLLLGA